MAKKEEFIPTDLVKRLYGEGRGETEVITQLRAQGFTPSQIDKALKAVPKPRHVPAHEPAPPHHEEEAYRGPLPKEVIRPVAKAEAPARPLISPLEGPVGTTTEAVRIPESLRPMGIPEHPAAVKILPAHRPVEKPEEKPPAPPAAQPVPQPAPVPAAIPGAPKISLEELVEQIVNEQERKLYAHLDKLQAEHDANVRKIADLSAKLADLSNSVKVLEKAVDSKSSFAADANKQLAAKMEALETAFKELSHFLKKK
ncbi:MAG: hypothetical protein QXD77_00015 [Candidatus Aenigmatarchaeota archaeon]